MTWLDTLRLGSDFMRRETPLGCLMLLVGLVLYIWPRVANAGAPYGENDIPAIIGLGVLLLGICIVFGSGDNN